MFNDDIVNIICWAVWNMTIFQNAFFSSKCFPSSWCTVIYLSPFPLYVTQMWPGIHLPLSKTKVLPHLHKDTNNVLRSLPLSVSVRGALMINLTFTLTFRLVELNKLHAKVKIWDLIARKYPLPHNVLLCSGQHFPGSNHKKSNVLIIFFCSPAHRLKNCLDVLVNWSLYNQAFTCDTSCWARLINHVKPVTSMYCTMF